jgi:hypothetical protein
VRALIASITPDADENLKMGWKVAHARRRRWRKDPGEG